VAKIGGILPLPSNDRGIHRHSYTQTHTHTDSNVIS
jgi:hypothetical protein